jgi:mannose-6-phosphate isomerase-like protein (cupin superfamily)
MLAIGRKLVTIGQIMTTTLLLEPGDSWIVPRGAHHSYRILEPFSAIEATHPPAVIHIRDEKTR